ncbi:MAG: hypothetical protein HY897_07840 [Deltaproteobacteria bacterium]|nr:hypothetical protein [Deltaproteobacteria bacterium]
MKTRLIVAMIAISAGAAMAFALSGPCRAAETPQPAADKLHYEVVTSASTSSLEVGKEGQLVVEIKATDGYEFHKESPLKMTVTETPGLEFQKLKFGKDDVKDVLKPVFKAPFKGAKAGKYEVSADLHFVVCISTICEIKRPAAKVPVEVK